MKVPKVSIKKNPNVIRYYIYRDTLEKLPNDISAYNKIEPIGCVFNTSDITQPVFIDNRGITQDGVDKYFSNPITISNPKVDTKTKIIKVRGKGNVPYYSAKITGVNDDILLHYRVLSDNDTGLVSDLSDISSVEISQDPEDISTWIEYYDNNSWIKLEDVVLNKMFDILKPTSSNSSTIFNSGVSSLNKDDVKFQNKYSRSDNIVIISVMNPWHYSNRHLNYRSAKPLRAVCTVGDGNILYSDIFNSKEQYSPIDRLVILRKEHDGTDSHLSISDNGIIVKQIIRAGGIYSTKEIENIQFNEETVTGDFSLVNFDNVFDKINIVDSGIIAGRKYKYTFICYDHCGDESAKYSVVNIA